MTREEIRTRLTYALPSGINDNEWEVIINNVELLLKEKEKEVRAEYEKESKI